MLGCLYARAQTHFKWPAAAGQSVNGKWNSTVCHSNYLKNGPFPSEGVKESTNIVILSPFAALRANCAKDLHWFVFKDTTDASLRSPENHPMRVIPTQAGIQLVGMWTPACAGAARVGIFIESGGPQAHENSVESHVIPAQAGIQLVGMWTPACAGVTKPTTFISMGGPPAHGHSG
jgi:hypothetical protein